MRRTVLLLASVALATLLASGVALAVTKHCRTDNKCTGTGESDRLLGDNGFNWMFGRDGNDTIKGFGSTDILNGSGGNDWLVGGNAYDELNGGPGRDRLQGSSGPDDYYFFFAGWGNDRIIDQGERQAYDNAAYFRALSAPLVIDMNSDPDSPEARTASGNSTVNWPDDVIGWLRSGAGDDEITGRGGFNRIAGADGDDLIRVNNGVGNDEVTCGRGEDTVFYDAGDTINGCEVHNPPTG